jgi:hypothetical protein
MTRIGAEATRWKPQEVGVVALNAPGDDPNGHATRTCGRWKNWTDNEAWTNCTSLQMGDN